LPDEKRFLELKQKYEERIQRRIAYEKELVLREQSQLSMISSSSFNQSHPFGTSSTSPTPVNRPKPATVVSVEEGFSTTTTSLSAEERAQLLQNEEDPMLQQMAIIRSYIRQARSNHRYEEVSMLEENLRELEIEYYFKQQQEGVEQEVEVNPIGTRSRSTTDQQTTSTNPFGDDEGDV